MNNIRLTPTFDWTPKIIGVNRGNGDIEVVCAFPDCSDIKIIRAVLAMVILTEDFGGAEIIDYDAGIEHIIPIEEGEQE